MRLRTSAKMILVIFTAVILLLQVPPIGAEGPKKVAILPFTMHADRDLAFLQEGIMDMLASRLAWKGEVEILEKGRVWEAVDRAGTPLSKEKALLVGKELAADYVILGSLTVFGESVSIDAKIMDVSRSEELMTAFNQTKGMDEVIPTVNRFAEDINEKIMGRVVARTPVYQAQPQVPQGPGGLSAPGERYEGKGLGHAQAFKVEMTGLDVGDVDGDGKNELVFTDKDSIYIYKWAGQGLARQKRIEGKWGPNYVRVDVADMDGNGRAEIYVSNPSGSSLSSRVLEWDGNAFKDIADGQKWFFRVIDLPGHGQKLIGQKRAIDGSYVGGVQVLKREGNDYVGTAALALPRKANVFNFGRADLSGRGDVFTVLLDSYERLVLYNKHGEEVWRSEDYFGGGLTYMEDKSGDSRQGAPGKYVFFPSPIHVTDLDGNGNKEIMICKNGSVSKRLFDSLRDFKNGEVRFLEWDKVGLSTKWNSRKLSGPVVGYQVGDIDNDGLDELIIAAVTKEEVLVRKPRTQVVIYDLN